MKNLSFALSYATESAILNMRHYSDEEYVTRVGVSDAGVTAFVLWRSPGKREEKDPVLALDVILQWGVLIHEETSFVFLYPWMCNTNVI